MYLQLQDNPSNSASRVPRKGMRYEVRYEVTAYVQAAARHRTLPRNADPKRCCTKHIFGFDTIKNLQAGVLQLGTCNDDDEKWTVCVILWTNTANLSRFFILRCPCSTRAKFLSRNPLLDSSRRRRQTPLGASRFLGGRVQFFSRGMCS